MDQGRAVRLKKREREVLERLAVTRGLPGTIVVDNGPEFSGRVLDRWAYERGVHLHFIEPGKPMQNAFVESFNGKFRDECPNQHWFVGLDDARSTIEQFRRDYNHYRPHRSHRGLTPEEFALRSAPSRRLRRLPGRRPRNSTCPRYSHNRWWSEGGHVRLPQLLFIHDHQR